MPKDNEKKKRGRPRKSDAKEEIEEEKLILKLPIKSLLKQKKNESKSSNLETATILDSNALSISDSSSKGEVNFVENKKTNDEIKKKDVLIQKMANKIKDLEEQVSDYTGHNRKITPMATNLIDMDGKKIKFKKTDLCCWWCTDKFNTEPVFLPCKYDDKGYHVYGVFCSFNCALAYNNNETHDFKRNERSSLLNKLYEEMYGEFQNIIEAPSRYVLKKYGGELSINQYRNNLIFNNKEYRVYIPPLLPVVPKIEEDYNDKTYVNNNIFGKVCEKQNLRLKRTKPLPGTSTNLFDVMNLKKKKNNKKK